LPIHIRQLAEKVGDNVLMKFVFKKLSRRFKPNGAAFFMTGLSFHPGCIPVKGDSLKNKQVAGTSSIEKR
jgi:hypothetical protein